MNAERFEDVVSFRLFTDIREEVKDYVRENPDLYENESHFYRAAVIKTLRAMRGYSEGSGELKEHGKTTQDNE